MPSNRARTLPVRLPTFGLGTVFISVQTVGVAVAVYVAVPAGGEVVVAVFAGGVGVGVLAGVGVRVGVFAGGGVGVGVGVPHDPPYFSTSDRI
ncbi:MAG: hypothetical protein ACR2M0_01400 [Chloroflexia bacterium]